MKKKKKMATGPVDLVLKVLHCMKPPPPDGWMDGWMDGWTGLTWKVAAGRLDIAMYCRLFCSV